MLSLCRSIQRHLSTGAAAGRQSGIVKFFNLTKGFGFITPNDGTGDVFVHQSNIHAKGFRALAEGEQVEFDIGAGDDGRLKALNVTGPQGDYVKGVPRERATNFSTGPRFPRGGGAQLPSRHDEW